MNSLEKRQKGFALHDKAIYKSMDVSESSVVKGTTQWHILNLCRVLDYLGHGAIEYDYVVSILEDRLREYEQDRAENSGICDKCGLEAYDPDCGCVCDCNHKCGRG